MSKKYKNLIQRLYYSDFIKNEKMGTPLRKSWQRPWVAPRVSQDGFAPPPLSS